MQMQKVWLKFHFHRVTILEDDDWASEGSKNLNSESRRPETKKFSNRESFYSSTGYTEKHQKRRQQSSRMLARHEIFIQFQSIFPHPESRVHQPKTFRWLWWVDADCRSLAHESVHHSNEILNLTLYEWRKRHKIILQSTRERNKRIEFIVCCFHIS